MNEVPVETRCAIAHALDALKAINSKNTIQLYPGSDFERVDIDKQYFAKWDLATKTLVDFKLPEWAAASMSHKMKGGEGGATIYGEASDGDIGGKANDYV